MHQQMLGVTSKQHQHDIDMTERQIRDWNKDATVTTVTPQKLKIDKFTNVMDKLDRELSE